MTFGNFVYTSYYKEIKYVHILNFVGENKFRF